MKSRRSQKINLVFAALGVLIVAFAYVFPLHPIIFLLTPWQYFGETSVTPISILDFEPKTQGWIGYIEPETKKGFTCKKSIAYVEAEDYKFYRCCNSDEKVSCVISSAAELPDNGKCTSAMKEEFHIPDQFRNSKDSKVSAYCPNSGIPNFTVVQITNSGKILWKSIDTLWIDVTIGVLRCYLGPAVILLVVLILGTKIVKSHRSIE